ncbi:transposase [Dickeya dianthicola]|uniref:transposase n=1 Tax=Dickeya dianthicola TaxID=204039 RepID=UPI00301B60F4
MFTEAEKIRAIELYYKYGKKLAPVVRELGYPSKRNLRRWIIGTLNAGEHPVIHRDRGGHYRWPGWLERVNASGMEWLLHRPDRSPSASITTSKSNGRIDPDPES